MKKRVAIQGQQASFHDIAAQEFLGGDYDIVSNDTFTDTFRALHNGQANLAIVAIENSLFGSINDVYDLLIKDKCWIIGEVYLRISQCLIGLPGTRLEDIKEVHSHPVALAQCVDYLDNVLPHAERFENHDTAGSVAAIKHWGDTTKVAIASAAAAKLHDLPILAEEIETHVQNYTRFVVLQKQLTQVKNANKTSLVLQTDHAPGALYRALGAFAKNDLNLTKLQSRPIVGKRWHYIFYVDVNDHYQSTAMKTALSELEKQGCKTTLLGSYPAGAN